MTQPLRIALVGLGTVGCGVIRLLEDNGDLIARRAGRPVKVVAVTARDRNKDRGVDLSGIRWVDDMAELAHADDVDIVVELIGGSDGPALTLARASLTAGKRFVTANKAMIAHHGQELAELAESRGSTLKYEAAVAGGIPAIKGIREGAAANRIERIYGILNGTCNFILSAMESEGRDFGEVLADAQIRGFAEADPSFDIDGIDAAHKLSILASLAYDARIDFGGVEVAGIRHIVAADISQAKALGYRIRLIGLAEMDDGHLFQRVNPYLIPEDHPLADIDGPTNAVVVEGNHVGRLLFQGRGAGDGPTASAVMADIIDIARGDVGPTLSTVATELEALGRAETGHRQSKAYVRFQVADKPGVLAEIAAAMRDANVSIESLIQKEAAIDAMATIAIVTHSCAESNVSDALGRLEGSSYLLAAPMVMRILAD